MYVIMISTVIVGGTSVLSAYGTIVEIPFALGSSIFLFVLAMILEFIGAIVILVYGVEESEILTKDLREVFFKLIYRMDHDERANRILKIVQEYVCKKLKKSAKAQLFRRKLLLSRKMNSLLFFP